MEIKLTITVLVVATIIGGLIILLGPAVFQKFKWLRYLFGIVLIVLGILALLHIPIRFVN
ncbi:MAG: hypothetical protein ACRETQ_09975 [Gammaproteobacteria bacterium]